MTTLLKDSHSIGIDFDNTIVCYDQVFYQVAIERGLIPPDVPSSKREVRNYLRRQGKEDLWTELQGFVYGIDIHHAKPFPGVIEFVRLCVQRGLKIFIISHKTQFPFAGPKYDLHQAARGWLENNGFLASHHLGLNQDQVYFESTKANKLARIATTACTHFIDDLPELLMDPAFPPNVQKILFSPYTYDAQTSGVKCFSSWAKIQEGLIG